MTLATWTRIPTVFLTLIALAGGCQDPDSQVDRDEDLEDRLERQGEALEDDWERFEDQVERDAERIEDDLDRKFD